MSKTVGNFFVERLYEWGVRTIFCYRGDGINGVLGAKPSHDMTMECDTLLMGGSGFPYTEFLPKEGQAGAVQIDIDPGMLSIRYPAEVNLHGDAAFAATMLKGDPNEGHMIAGTARQVLSPILLEDKS